MSQLATIGCASVDASDTSIGSFILTPMSSRNGVVTLDGEENGSTYLPDGSNMRVTLSVRPGRPADLVNDVKRVKRKFIAKTRIPVLTPGLLANGVVGEVLDYVDAELTIQAPVEADIGVIRTAARSLAPDSGVLFTGFVEDMLLKGHEPY